MLGTLSKALILSGIFICLLFSRGLAKDTNVWPLMVKQGVSLDSRPEHTGSLGPLLSETLRGQTRILSIRPLWTQFTDATAGSASYHLLYPVANWMDNGSVQFGHVLNLVQFRRDLDREVTFFQAFPFIFSQRSPEPDQSYFALWPLGGVLKNRLWRDRIRFVAWPLFVQTERGDETRTHLPYPFVQHLQGPRSRGFGLWPLYGHFEREADYSRTWALWPIFYHYRDNLDEAVPYERFGVLPFYHRETAAGLQSETFLWPFFGYTRETDPRPAYSENRYFWPLLVQGHGEERRVNRWMPLYTHERRPGYRKEWYLWPLLERETFEQPGLLRERDSFLYFLYRDERQHFAGRTARLTFLWPLLGYWHDGYERTQVQLLDPLGVFFPSNQKVKENWTPLFALYRYDLRGQAARHSVLWDLLVWERDAAGLSSFYAGPLFEWHRGGQWDLLKGLIGRSTEADGPRMTFFWSN